MTERKADIQHIGLSVGVRFQSAWIYMRGYTDAPKVSRENWWMSFPDEPGRYHCPPSQWHLISISNPFCMTELRLGQGALC